MIIRSSDELIGNKAHFDKLYAMIDDPNFIATYYNYLKIWILAIFIFAAFLTRNTNKIYKNYHYIKVTSFHF